MRLAVEHDAALVDVAVEVDGELRHPGDRVGHGHEGVGAVGEHEAAGDAEVAVEPAVEEDAAVDLDAELAPPGPPAVGVRLDPQPGGVRVGADDAHRQRSRAGRAAPGDEGAAARHVAGGRQLGPRLGLGDGDEAAGPEQAGRRVDGVPRRR